MANEGHAPFERVLLVGLMGSGKSHVGQALSDTLGWSFRDFDQEISERVGLSIPEIFRQHGEGFFREIEGKVGAELLLEREVVLASGGGWPVALDRMESLEAATFSVWLQVSAEESVRRARIHGAARPLLAVADPVARARALLKERESSYGKAHVAIDTAQAGPGELARIIKDLMNEKGRDFSRPLPLYK